MRRVRVRVFRDSNSPPPPESHRAALGRIASALAPTPGSGSELFLQSKPMWIGNTNANKAVVVAGSHGLPVSICGHEPAPPNGEWLGVAPFALVPGPRRLFFIAAAQTPRIWAQCPEGRAPAVGWLGLVCGTVTKGTLGISISSDAFFAFPGMPAMPARRLRSQFFKIHAIRPMQQCPRCNSNGRSSPTGMFMLQMCMRHFRKSASRFELSLSSFHSAGKLDSESMGTDKNVLALLAQASYKTSAQLSVFGSKLRLIRVFLGSQPSGAVKLTWSRNAKLLSRLGSLWRRIFRTMDESSEHTYCVYRFCAVGSVNQVVHPW